MSRIKMLIYRVIKVNGWLLHMEQERGLDLGN